MIIQHNLAALNANRNLGVTTKKSAKSTEKLSSGYKINRAADNVAGLAISEKMRGQIRGLNRASDNAEDGISLVQTAEGAMQESQNILQRMRELCVQAANDTNTTDDRSQIKVELDELSKEVDRIANTTEFNGMKLLNGDHSLKAKDIQTRVQEYLKGSWIPNAMSRIQEATGLTLHGNITMKVEFKTGMGNALASMTGSFGGSDFTLSISTDALNGMTASDFHTSSGPEIGGILSDRVITHEFTHAVTMQNFKTQPPGWFMEGIAEAVQGNHRSANQTPAEAAANISGGDDYEFGYYAIHYMQHNGQFDAFLDELGKSSFDDAVKKYYGEASGDSLKTKIQNLAAAGIEGFLGMCHIDPADGKDDAIMDWDAAPKDVNPSGGGVIAIESKVERIAIGEASCEITWAETSYERKGFRLQIGSNGGQELELNMGCLKSKELYGSEDIDVSSYSAASASITRFDGAIRTVSYHRAKLGAIQNRLEHTIANLDNSEENLQSSESKMRDTDMADEMTRYSKNNILMQAGQSMLAQANQATQGVVSLLQ